MREMHGSFFTSSRTGRLAALAVAAALLAASGLTAQEGTAPATPAAQTGSPTTSEPVPVTSNAAQVGAQTSPEAQPAPAADATLSSGSSRRSKKPKVAKADRLQRTKDTKVALRKQNKFNPLADKDAQLPDKQLYDKALAQSKSGHFDIARLDLQTLLNTYPDSQYQMRAKLAVADTWFREGGSAALTQAIQEYQDFITFFPNSPEAAEAQMRVGDIYFKQMDVPDRDYSKAVHAQDEYRNMLKQYPDAPKEVLTQARQKLREVQEVLASREYELGQFYSTHENWPATIARYQTVVDTYPQYSHMDETLIGLGDAYAAESRIVRTQVTCSAQPVGPCLPEAAKAKLQQDYDGKASAAYRQVVLQHAAAPHVEDAKERLLDMNLPVPTPSAEQVAASEALEGSRAQYDLRKRLELLFLRKPDTVTAAGEGDPPLVDPPITTAPAVAKSLMASYKEALDPGSTVSAAKVTPTPAVEDSRELPPKPTTAPGVTPGGAPPTLSDVAPAGARSASGSDVSEATSATPGTPDARIGNSRAGLGVEVLTPGASPDRDPSAPGPVSSPDTPPSSLPAATGKQDPNFGLTSAAPADTAPLPVAQAPQAAPDQINEAAGKPQPPAEVKDPSRKKKPKPAFDKDDESSSKHPKKKGIDKLNPF